MELKHMILCIIFRAEQIVAWGSLKAPCIVRSVTEYILYTSLDIKGAFNSMKSRSISYLLTRLRCTKPHYELTRYQNT